MRVVARDQAGGSIEMPGVGDVVGSYGIQAVLGHGGMGTVFSALDKEGREIALKLVKSDLAEDLLFRRRFDREVSAARRVSHPHVVPTIANGEHERIPWLAQPLVPGGSLEQLLRRRGTLELETVVRLCLQVAAGLDAIHETGLVHRDLKPANILLDTDGAAYITDFGLAKAHDYSVLTRPGTAVGTMDYMAPEQIRGQEVGAPTDVYALGCVMYECLAGRPPFADKEGMRVLWAHLQDEPPDVFSERADLPKDLRWALMRALEKEPDRRPPTATAYARMLQVAAGVPPMS